MYAVFDVEAGKAGGLDDVLKDDLVSRQSIVVRDAKPLGFPDRGRLVLVEGTEPAIARATELFADLGRKLAPEDAEAVYRAIKAQEDDAASGMGLIFG